MNWMLISGVFVCANAWADPPADAIPVGLRCLKAAYPDHICSVKPNALVWCDGTVMPYDDGIRNKTFAQKLANPDLEDQMSLRYSREDETSWRPQQDDDPGRIRYEPFFRKLYGGDRRSVRKKTRSVQWGVAGTKRRLRMTTVNGVDRKLGAIADALSSLPSSVQRTARKTAGGFHWRRIRGTGRLSMHSFGVAVDVGMNVADYWRWRGVERYRNRLPLRLARRGAVCRPNRTISRRSRLEGVQSPSLLFLRRGRRPLARPAGPKAV